MVLVPRLFTFETAGGIFHGFKFETKAINLQRGFDGLRELFSSLLRLNTTGFEPPSDGRLWLEAAIDLLPAESPLRARRRRSAPVSFTVVGPRFRPYLTRVGG
jgi:hypothetical protein